MKPTIVDLNTRGGARKPTAAGAPARPAVDWTGHRYKHETELRVNWDHEGRDRDTGKRSHNPLPRRTIPHMPGLAGIRRTEDV